MHTNFTVALQYYSIICRRLYYQEYNIIAYVYMLDDSGAWFTGFTQVVVLIVHEGVARVVYQNNPQV